MEKRKQSKSQMRNLSQYKDMSEEDFDSLWENIQKGNLFEKDLRDRIDKKIEEFGQDYDLDDLKINDKETLRSLATALISLEDYENITYFLRTNGVTASNITIVDRLQKAISDIRRDISKFQEDLNITRKIRKSDKESSVISYISNLKEQAKRFYEAKSIYIFCPKCNMLLATLWVLYPDKDNILSLQCHRDNGDNDVCLHKFEVNTKDLYEDGTNKKEIMPEGIL